MACVPRCWALTMCRSVAARCPVACAMRILRSARSASEKSLSFSIASPRRPSMPPRRRWELVRPALAAAAFFFASSSSSVTFTPRPVAGRAWVKEGESFWRGGPRRAAARSAGNGDRFRQLQRGRRLSTRPFAPGRSFKVRSSCGATVTAFRSMVAGACPPPLFRLTVGRAVGGCEPPPRGCTVTADIRADGPRRR